MPTNNKGLFITFEGIDGSGKSTQARLLLDRLKSEGRDVVFTREPGGTGVKISEKIRNVVLNHTSMEMVWKTELLLFMASRAQHIEELIAPSLKKGMIIICDRFADASVAYQGHARGLDMDWIKKLNLFACGDIWPHKTFLLDISADVFTERKKKENKSHDRIEKGGAAFQAKVREGYLALAKAEPGRFSCHNGTLPQEEIHQQIYSVVQKMLSGSANS